METHAHRVTAPNEELIKKIVGDHMGIPGPALSLKDHITKDLGADSLDRLELIMTVEEFFQVKLSDNDTSNIERIGDILKAVIRATK